MAMSYRARAILKLLIANGVTDTEEFWATYSKNFDQFEISRLAMDFDKAVEEYNRRNEKVRRDP